jgi:hypothetical protein
MKRSPADQTQFPFWLLLIPVILLGFIVFVTDLTETSLWSDEGWTIAATDDTSPTEIITDWVKPDVHPPLFFLGLRGWRVFTGNSIFEMRYYSVMLSLLGIVLAYRLGKSLFNERAGLFAALFYGLHDLVNVLAQEVRHYPQQMLLVTLTMWLYWRFYQQVSREQSPSRSRAIAFILAGTALLYTHYWGGFILFGMGLHTLLTQWHNRPTFRRLFTAFAGIGLLYLPWLPVLVHQISLERPGGLPHALENSHWVYRVLLYQLVGTPEVLWLALAIVGAIGAYAATPPRWKPSPATTLPLIVALTVPALSILLNTQYPTLSFRALAVVVPVAIVLAANGLAQFGTREQVVMVAFITVFSLTNTSARPVTAPPWPEIAQYIASHSDSSDIVLMENDTDEHTLAYYLQQTGANVTVAHTQFTRERHPDDYAATLETLLDGVNGIWVSQLDKPPYYDIRPDLAQMGFIMSAPERQDGVYDDRPILLWRLDRVTQEQPIAVFGGELALLNAEATTTPDGVVVNLLWSPQIIPTQDYSVSVKLFDANGAVIDQLDSLPQDNTALTSTWTNDGLYFDSRLLSTNSPGTYRVGLTLYYLTGETDPPYVNLTIDDCDEGECVVWMLDDLLTR